MGEDAGAEAVEVEANPQEAGLRSKTRVRKEELLPLEEEDDDFKPEEDVVMVAASAASANVEVRCGHCREDGQSALAAKPCTDALSVRRRWRSRRGFLTSSEYLLLPCHLDQLKKPIVAQLSSAHDQEDLRRRR